MAVIVYPGTFDPITNGHVDLIARACALFEKVIIAVAMAKHKQTLFNFEQRLAFVKQTFVHNSNVTALPLEGLLVDFVVVNKATTILRGVRSGTDFDYEFQLAGMNRSLNSKIETIFMLPAEKMQFISSSGVRELLALNQDISGFVPKGVIEGIRHGA